MRSVGETEFLDVVARIYEAGLNFHDWPQALMRIADLFGARDASLGAMAPGALPWIFAPRTDPEFMRNYAEAYHPLDDVWHGVTRRGVGRPATDDMVMPRDLLAKSAFHNEWSRPQGYSTIMGGMILADRGWRTVLMLPGETVYGRDDLELFEALTPHIRRAVQMNLRLAQADLNSGLATQLLEEMTAAALLLDADGRVLFANPAAYALFRSGRGMTLSNGRLTATRAEDAQALDTALAGCVLWPPRNPGIVIVGREPSLRLRFTPVRREMPLLGPGLPAALVLEDAARGAIGIADQLRLTYGLTRAEALLAIEIAKGDGKRAAADRRGIAFSTARTHLSHIFEKTGVNRQAELVRLVLGFGPPGDRSTPPG